MIDTAVILAAGNGTRLRGVSKDLPKPLVSLAGVPILVRIMVQAQRAGIRRFVVVTGYKADMVKTAILEHPAVTAQVDFVDNPEYKHKGNGVSALAAEVAIDGPFALLMADHIFDVDVLRRLLREPLPEGHCMLAVDHKIDEVFDIDDATKVVEKDGELSEIGKELGSYNAIDTGMFTCNPALFGKLREVKEEKGDCSLSNAVQLLAAEDRMKTYDIGDALWQDVDTPEMRKEAKRRLGQSLRKETDGPISRLINRRVSIPTSMALIKLRVTPNQISVFNLLLGITTGVLYAYAGILHPGDWAYPLLALAGIFFQMGSILDGCDGEVARVTFRQSAYGQWMDTITDNLSYVAFLVGLIVGQVYREPTMLTLGLGLTAVFAILTSLIVMYQRISAMGKGSLLDFQIPDASQVDVATGRIFRIYDSVRPLVRRDVFAFGVMLLSIANLPGIIFGLWVVGAVGLMGAVLHITSQRVQRQLAPAVAKEG